MERIGCVVVTFNKVNLLQECISSLLNQTVEIDKIIIVDNASTDKTQKYLEKVTETNTNIINCRLEKNLGGAGGFNYGLKLAYQYDLDYIWIMDDDTIPNIDALSKLLNVATKENFNWGFLSSNVKWLDNTPCVMNIPITDKIWSEYLEHGLVKVVSSTFVSLLIKKEIISEVGFPISDFFIWGDDTEFTRRISSKYPGYLVIDSIVTHKMLKNIDVDIINDSSDRLIRYFYRYRNKVYMSKKYGLKDFINFFLHTCNTIVKILKKGGTAKYRKLLIVTKGYIAGLFFNPKIEFPQQNGNLFKNS